MVLCTMKNCYPPLTHLAAALLGAAVATMLLRPTQSLHVLPAGAHVLLHILRGVPVLIPHWSGVWSGQNEIDDTHCPRGPRVESRYVRLRIDSSHIRFRRSGHATRAGPSRARHGSGGAPNPRLPQTFARLTNHATSWRASASSRGAEPHTQPRKFDPKSEISKTRFGGFLGGGGCSRAACGHEREISILYCTVDD